MVSNEMPSPGLENFLRRSFPLLLLIGILVNATGLFSDILEPDGALYASIAKNMLLSGDWFNMVYDNTDWLDKPHFPFWVAATSFKIFGINSFAYKFPAFIFWLIGLRFTWLTARQFYSVIIADISVLVYSIALHGMLANFDVRAEAYLSALIIAAVYYLQRALTTQKWIYFVSAALFTACAIMTKGIFILATVGSGFAFYWLFTRQYRQFINLRLWVYVILTFIFISPELYALYVQFDMHPEKTVFGQQDVSGIRFFFWDSQFGRFFNNGPIKGKGDPFFFLHTSIWAFLPWGPLIFIAVAKLLRNPKLVLRSQQSIIVCSMLVSFTLFSLSRFQLPHYIVVLFPHFAMITANYLLSLYQETGITREKKFVSTYFTAILIAAAIGVSAFTFVFTVQWKILIFIFIGTLMIISLQYRKGLNAVLIKAFAFAIIIYPFMNFHFFPSLLQYQAGMKAAKWLQHENKRYDGAVISYGKAIASLNFYLSAPTKSIDNTAALAEAVEAEKMPVIVYADITDEKNIRKTGLSVKLLQRFESFPVSRLTFKFLDPNTREKMTSKTALFLLQEPGSEGVAGSK